MKGQYIFSLSCWIHLVEANLLSMITHFEVSDINECTDGSHNCNINADCNNTPGSFTCSCKAGYQGDGIICTGKIWPLAHSL